MSCDRFDEAIHEQRVVTWRVTVIVVLRDFDLRVVSDALERKIRA